MFDHVVFGVSDYATSTASFVNALKLCVVVVVVSEGPPGVELGRADSKSSLCLRRVEAKASHLHLAFTAENLGQVYACYRAALEAGEDYNGAPGLRPLYHANCYAAFLIGSDRPNFETVCHEAEGGLAQ